MLKLNSKPKATNKQSLDPTIIEQYLYLKTNPINYHTCRIYIMQIYIPVVQSSNSRIDFFKE